MPAVRTRGEESTVTAAHALSHIQWLIFLIRVEVLEEFNGYLVRARCGSDALLEDQLDHS